MDESEKEEQARLELVKLASDNDMYFVVWWGHFGNYFVGVRNDRSIKPEIYKAIYESFYDLIADDKVMFRFGFQANDSSSKTAFSWVDLLEKAVPKTVKSIVENLGSKPGKQQAEIAEENGR